MKTFKKFIEEDVSVGGGALGPAAATGHGGSVGNTDWYAPGDARIHTVLGAKTVKKKGKKKTVFPIQRRSLTSNM
jgi:hypothetical protein